MWKLEPKDMYSETTRLCGCAINIWNRTACAPSLWEREDNRQLRFRLFYKTQISSLHKCTQALVWAPASLMSTKSTETAVMYKKWSVQVVWVLWNEPQQRDQSSWTICKKHLLTSLLKMKILFRSNLELHFRKKRLNT